MHGESILTDLGLAIVAAALAYADNLTLLKQVRRLNPRARNPVRRDA